MTLVRRLEEKWQVAVRDHNVEVLEKLMADDFVATSSTGRRGSKATVLAEARNDKNVYTRAEARSMSVRLQGENVAIVTGVARESGTTPAGKKFDTSRRFTDTWELRDGRWVCVASKATKIPRR